MVAPHDAELTTREATHLLNISRPTLVRFLTDGEIPYSMHGRHRRVLLCDILDCRERTRRKRREILDAMIADAEEDDLYRLAVTPRPAR